MKPNFLLSSLVAAAVMAFAPAAIAQTPRLNGGPGIVMSASQNASSLPKDAQDFIKKHFDGVSIVKCEQYFAKGKYEVELANGVDIDFDTKGKVLEIDAPDGSLLPSSLIKEVLPHKAFSRLQESGLDAQVESIEFNKRGKAIEVELSVPDPDCYVFDIDGNFVAISD